MGKRMKLPFLSHSKSLDSKRLSPSSPYGFPPYGFPTCGHLKTLSFRATAQDEDDNPFRTFNSAFLDASSSSRSFSTLMSDEDSGDPVETVIQGLRSDRLFFEPEQSSSLVAVEENRENKGCFSDGEEIRDEEKVIGYKKSEMLWVDSSNPYEDFKRSMEEMVEAHGLMKDWDGLEELLSCYLKINGKNNHGYILGAFIDLLVSSFSSLPSTSSTSTRTITNPLSSSNSNIVYSSPSSPLSLPSTSLTTPSLSSTLDIHDGDDDNHDDHVSS